MPEWWYGSSSASGRPAAPPSSGAASSVGPSASTPSSEYSAYLAEQKSLQQKYSELQAAFSYEQQIYWRTINSQPEPAHMCTSPLACECGPRARLSC